MLWFQTGGGQECGRSVKPNKEANKVKAFHLFPLDIYKVFMGSYTWFQNYSIMIMFIGECIQRSDYSFLLVNSSK